MGYARFSAMEMLSVTSILFLILDPPRGQIDFPLRVLGDEFLEDLPVVFVVGFQAGLREGSLSDGAVAGNTAVCVAAHETWTDDISP